MRTKPWIGTLNFGSDYPHPEGPYGHPQQTLQDLFPEYRHRPT